MINEPVLFRGISEETGKWVYGYLYILGEETEYAESYILGNLDYRESVHDLWKCATRVIRKTVGQYTGLKDKNAKPIFGGDIVINDVGKKRIVEYYNGRFSPFILFPEYNCWNPWECEVVGSIYDNYTK